MPRKKIDEPEVSGQDEVQGDINATEPPQDNPIAIDDADESLESAKGVDIVSGTAVKKRQTRKRDSEQDAVLSEETEMHSESAELSASVHASGLPAMTDTDEPMGEATDGHVNEDVLSEEFDTPHDRFMHPEPAVENTAERAVADSADIYFNLTDNVIDDVPEDKPADMEPDESDGRSTPIGSDTEESDVPKKEKAKPTRARKKTIHDLNLNSLDRDLTPEEQQEWSSIYASYRSKSILTGTVIGADEHTFDVRDRETGEIESKKLTSLIIIGFRVKVLIPESEMWMPGEERPSFVLRNMTGSMIDYVIVEIDREGQCAIGSRRVAIAAKRHYFATARGGHPEGELLKCRVLISGPHRCTVEVGGYDIRLSQRELSYTMLPDLRERFHPGQELNCRLKSYDRNDGKLLVSVKEASPNPFIGADARHPVGSRRQAVISGKYAGGVFCTLPDDTVCLCLYSVRHSDIDFAIGDKAIILIRSYNYDKQLVYGRILSKW